MTRKPLKKPRIGLYTIGLAAYWPRFPGLQERLFPVLNGKVAQVRK